MLSWTLSRKNEARRRKGITRGEVGQGCSLYLSDHPKWDLKSSLEGKSIVGMKTLLHCTLCTVLQTLNTAVKIWHTSSTTPSQYRVWFRWRQVYVLGDSRRLTHHRYTGDWRRSPQRPPGECCKKRIAGWPTRPQRDDIVLFLSLFRHPLTHCRRRQRASWDRQLSHDFCGHCANLSTSWNVAVWRCFDGVTFQSSTLNRKKTIQKLYSLTNIVRAIKSKLWNSKNHFGVDTRYMNSCPYKTSFPDHP